MKLKVLISTKGVENLKGCVAFVSLNFNDVFAVTGVKLMEGSKGYWLAFPSYKAKNGDYKDICYPLTKEARESLIKRVVAEYEKATNAEEVPFN